MISQKAATSTVTADISAMPSPTSPTYSYCATFNCTPAHLCAKWQDCLAGFCKQLGISEPSYQEFSDPRGKQHPIPSNPMNIRNSSPQSLLPSPIPIPKWLAGYKSGRTAWTVVVTILIPPKLSARARFYYDVAYINNANEDAAELAMQHLQVIFPLAQVPRPFCRQCSRGR
ncbi:hypothetical protein HOY82DRAFT_544258 [Tuber indicum]|nr:hypothetical protein HOY82DRAFT_544258 [Tuber indicum]